MVVWHVGGLLVGGNWIAVIRLLELEILKWDWGYEKIAVNICVIANSELCGCRNMSTTDFNSGQCTRCTYSIPYFLLFLFIIHGWWSQVLLVYFWLQQHSRELTLWLSLTNLKILVSLRLNWLRLWSTSRGVECYIVLAIVVIQKWSTDKMFDFGLILLIICIYICISISISISINICMYSHMYINLIE